MLEEGEWAVARRLGKWEGKWEDSVGVLECYEILYDFIFTINSNEYKVSVVQI